MFQCIELYFFSFYYYYSLSVVFSCPSILLLFLVFCCSTSFCWYLQSSSSAFCSYVLHPSSISPTLCSSFFFCSSLCIALSILPSVFQIPPLPINHTSLVQLSPFLLWYPLLLQLYFQDLIIFTTTFLLSSLISTCSQIQKTVRFTSPSHFLGLFIGSVNPTNLLHRILLFNFLLSSSL